MKLTHVLAALSLTAALLITAPVSAQTVDIGESVVEPGNFGVVQVDLASGTQAAGVNLDLDIAVTGLSTSVGPTSLGLTGNSDLGAPYNGQTYLQNDTEVGAGKFYAVIANTSSTSTFSGDGSLAALFSSIPGNTPKGAQITINDSGSSGVSDANGNSVGSVAGGSITVTTDFPLAQSFAAGNGQSWESFTGPIGAPFSFASPTANTGAQGLELVNSGVFRVFGNWNSPDLLVKFYDKCLNIVDYTVQSNRADVVRGAWMRFRGGVLNDASTPELRNTIATLPEYQISQAQPQPPAGAITDSLPNSTPRTYNMPWANEDASQVFPAKKLGFDLINFTEGIAADFAYILTNIAVNRYDLDRINADAVLLDTIDFTLFSAAPDNLFTGVLFPRNPDGSLISGFDNFASPAKAINNAGNLATQELVYNWSGGNANDNVVSFFSTEFFDGSFLTSRYNDVLVDSDDLYIIRFYVGARGAGLADRTVVPGHRYRMNIWKSGESWAINANPLQAATTTPATGDAELVEVNMYILAQPEADGGQFTFVFEAINFLQNYPLATGAGDTYVNRVELYGIDNFRGTTGNYILDN